MPGKSSARRWMVVAVATLIMNTVLAGAVIASHRFTDVPESNVFHDDISWLADNDITRGCNPPANTRFCPDANVSRSQMAAFMHRFARAFGTAGASTNTPATVGSAMPAELASITVDPKDEAGVVLNAFVAGSIPSGAMLYVHIGRDDCASINRVSQQTFTRDPDGALALTYRDVTTGPTVYKLCGVLSMGSTVTIYDRALTAFWTPTG